MEMRLFLILLISNTRVGLCISKKVSDEDNSYYPFDRKLYRDVLDPELCRQQVEYLRNNNTMLWARFLDAGIRIPRGMFVGNRKDMGNYYECLDIKHVVNEINLQGKYCVMQIKLKPETNLSISQEPEGINYAPFKEQFNLMRNAINEINQVEIYSVQPGMMYDPIYKADEIQLHNSSSSLDLILAICIPASCTANEAINSLLPDISTLVVTYEEMFCRLPDDKPWSPVDYIATVIFSILGIVTFLSTSYDLCYSLIFVKDKRNTNSLYFSFSVYTNTRRLLTFTSGPDSLECVDGIRTLAMMWVIIGHTFSALPNFSNIFNVLEFAISPTSVWLTSAHLTVDTFFLISGMLVVYTTAGKITGERLLRQLHNFYLNRLLRMFPLLAAMTLFEASFYNYVADGPFWQGAAGGTLRCRQYWWSTLLHIQNFANPKNICLGVSWYLSVDVQLHFLSPIILYWVLSPRKRFAWAGLGFGLLIALMTSSLYVYFYHYPSGPLPPSAIENITNFFQYYYINLLTRAPPFFVGMTLGYVLYVWRGKVFKIEKIFLLILWCCSFVLIGSSIYCMYFNLRLYWEKQIADKFINSFTRSLWAVGLGWIIFACEKGYGGPINWFLSLQMWKLPARLSYTMFLIHYSIIVAYYYSALEPIYFTVGRMIFNYFSFLLLTFVIAFVVTIIIDSPFSTLIKMLMKAQIKT